MGVVDGGSPVTGVCDGAGSCEACTPTTGGTCVPSALFASFMGPSTWSVAETDCVARGGHLASVHSDAQRATIHAVCRDTGGGSYTPKGCWIGMTDELWIDGSPMDYTAWSPDHDRSGPCVWQYLTPYPTLWDDQPCGFTLPYVCKLPVTASTVGATTVMALP
jgi:hypothetical protein